jgi:hypothetical protein
LDICGRGWGDRKQQRLYWRHSGAGRQPAGVYPGRQYFHHLAVSLGLSVRHKLHHYVCGGAAQQLLNAGGWDFQVYLDTNLLGTFHPASGSYNNYYY